MAWYNSSWTYRQKVTIDATKVDEIFQVFPIYTSKLNRHFWDNAKAGAADVRITRADGTTEIARYVVSHDTTNFVGCILADVHGDVSISTDTSYYVYYGNSGASDYSASATYGRNAVFNNYAGAYLPGMSTTDLTGSGRDLTAVNTPTTDTSGYEGITAAKYASASSQYHKYEGTPCVTTWPSSIETLAYANNVTADMHIAAISKNTGTTNQFGIQFQGTAGSDPVRGLFCGDTGSYSLPTKTSFSASTWYYLATTRSGTTTGTSSVYIDAGTAGTNSTTLTAAASMDRTAIGRQYYNSSQAGTLNYLDGRVAWVGLSSSVRSANYITTMYNAWSSSTFFSASTIETETGGTTGWVLFQTAATTSLSGTQTDWSNPNNALSINADAATAVVDDLTNTFTEKLKLTNPAYGITIPSGQTTYGCKFRIRRTGQTSSGRVLTDEVVKLLDNSGAEYGSNLADTATTWPASATNKDYTFSGASISNSTFNSSAGLVIQVDATATNGNTTASVITAWMQVTWDTPAGGNTGTGALTAPAGTTSGSGHSTHIATGAVTAPHGTLSGSGLVGKTGTGSLTAPHSTVSGAGKSTHIGTGAIVAPAPTVSGSGITGRTATGALTAPHPSLISGTAGVGRSGTGSVSAPPAVLSGSGTQTIHGTGSITAPAGTIAGSGALDTGVHGTGALEAPMPLVASTGNIESGDQDLVGALTAPAAVIAASAITGKTGTATLVAPKPTVAGSGRSTVSGTGALTSPSAYVVSGIAVNSPPAIVGTGALTGHAPTISGTGFVVDSDEATVDSIAWYHSGASAEGKSQRDLYLSLGGFRSSTPVKSVTWDCEQPMIGVEILGLNALNGIGTGSLEAISDNTIAWTPPGGVQGIAVALQAGDEAQLFGFDSGAWIRVRRNSTLPMMGIHSVQCLDVYNNAIAFENVASSDAIAGLTTYWNIMGHNPYGGPMINFKAWLDADANDNISIWLEPATAGEVQTIANETIEPTGAVWSSATTEGAAQVLPSVEAGGSFALWIRRIIPADSDPSPRLLNFIHTKFSDLTTADHYDDLRGKYRISREDVVTYGLWVGQDAEPDLSLDPTETFTSRPHTTSLSLDPSHTYYAVVRRRNKWGLWSQNRTATTLVMDADGEQGFVPPSAPSVVAITQQAGASNFPIISARYEPAIDGDNRAQFFVVWYTRDDTTPDPTDPPSGYGTMNLRSGIQALKYTGTGQEFVDGTPIKALVRTRRAAVGVGDAFSPDTTQLPETGDGTIVVASELAGWPATGLMKVTTFSGATKEIIEYDDLTVGTGVSTFTVLSGGRQQWGTTSDVTLPTDVIYPIEAVDSTNADITEYEIDGIEPGRPWGELLFGAEAAQQQAPISGPDGSTPQYIDEPYNIYLLSGEGWTELWMDTVLVWKVFQDGGNATTNALYVPNDWSFVEGSVSGAGTGVFDVTSATDLYVVAGTTRRVKIDANAMTITLPALSAIGGLPEVAPQYSTWEQYAGSLLQCWDPSIEDYRPYLQLKSDGELASQWVVDNTLTQSEIVAL